MAGLLHAICTRRTFTFSNVATSVSLERRSCRHGFCGTCVTSESDSNQANHNVDNYYTNDMGCLSFSCFSLSALSSVVAACVLLSSCGGDSCDEWVPVPMDPRIYRAQGGQAIGTDGSIFDTPRAEGFPGFEFIVEATEISRPLLGMYTPFLVPDITTVSYAVVGQGGTIVISGDAGVTWSAVLDSPTKEDLFGVRFSCTQRDYGLIGGRNGVILITESGGEAWETRQSGTQQTLRDIAPLDNDVAIAVGSSGTILRSVNRGLDWSPVPSGTSVDLLSLTFGDCYDQPEHGDARGVAVGEGGVVVVSEDHGATWRRIELHMDHKLTQVHLYFPSLVDRDAAEIALIGGQEIAYWRFGDDSVFKRQTFSSEVSFYDRDSFPVYVGGEGVMFAYKDSSWCSPND